VNISNSSVEISKAARDIVSEGGLYEADYNLCSWIEAPAVDINRINSGDTATEKCLQNFWRNRGGDSRGIEFPTLAKWLGKTIGEFKQSFQLISDDVNSTDMDRQSVAINKKYGVKSYKENVTTKYIPKPRNCERELISSTQSSCPEFVSLGQSIPSYNNIYRVKPGKDAVAGGKACVLEETKTCATIACDPVDCIGEMRETPCNVTCGTGTKTSYYVVTRSAQCGGRQCTVQPSVDTTCEARECAKDDCQYDRYVEEECPTEPDSDANCGKTFERKTVFTPRGSNSPDSLRFCPTSPLIESCGAAVACPPPVVPREPSTTGCLSLVTDGEIQYYNENGVTQIVVRDDNFIIPTRRRMPNNYGQQSHTQINSQRVGGGFGSGGTPTNITGEGVPAGTKITYYRFGTSNNGSNQNAIFITLDKQIRIQSAEFCYS
jgi:Sec-independent protein translocase protein TatA